MKYSQGFAALWIQAMDVSLDFFICIDIEAVI